MLFLYLLFFSIAPCFAQKIYVYELSDGVIHFSTSPPKGGIAYEVFTAKGSYSRWYPAKRKEQLFLRAYKDIIQLAAERTGLSEALIRAVIHAESAFNPKAVSAKGASGLMQIAPQNFSKFNIRDPFDPYQNIMAGSLYLKKLYEKYRNISLALAAYNAGEQAVDKYRAVPP
ncbi:MAG: lytic transglycosylase domain-containing protein, partial [Candidatus Dadabacteria bacterium]